MNNDIPFFSVIIPSYNREKYIVKALDSLAYQNFRNFETIVIDDCSTDNSYQLAVTHPLENKTVIKNEVNSERCISRNNGIKAAKGKYICFLDSDDYHLPNHLQVLYDEIQKRGDPTALFFTNAWGENSLYGRKERVCPDLENHNTFHYILTYTFNPQRTAVHRSIFDEFQFDPKIPGVEDLDIFLRIAVKYPVIQIKERTTVYVMHEEAYTMSKERPAKELCNFAYIFNKPELKPYLPKQSTNRLISMCHFHLAQIAHEDKKRGNAIKHTLLSFFLFPQGYNGKTNKILLVLLLYNIPLLGKVVRLIKQMLSHG